jgi:hypothetical protein
MAELMGRVNASRPYWFMRPHAGRHGRGTKQVRQSITEGLVVLPTPLVEFVPAPAAFDPGQGAGRDRVPDFQIAELLGPRDLQRWSAAPQ